MALNTLPKNNRSLVFLTSDAKLDLGLANWALGRRPEGFQACLQATEDLIGDDDYINKADFLPNVLLALHRLASTGVGAAAQRARADELFKKGVPLVKTDDKYSTAFALHTLAAGGPHQDANEHVRKILTKAPGLDWALWSALYLALDDPKQGQDLIALLPEKSVERRIAEVELHGPMTQPRSP
jgi:hypothetical protein